MQSLFPDSLFDDCRLAQCRFVRPSALIISLHNFEEFHIRGIILKVKWTDPEVFVHELGESVKDIIVVMVRNSARPNMFMCFRIRSGQILAVHPPIFAYLVSESLLQEGRS